MCLIITVTFTALLFLNSIPQIAGFPYLFRSRNGQIDDDLMASERQVEDEDVGQVYKKLQELPRHFEEDDQQIVNGNIQLTRLIESSSCKKDEETQKKISVVISTTVIQDKRISYGIVH
jgi:hypothetical protein